MNNTWVVLKLPTETPRDGGPLDEPFGGRRNRAATANTIQLDRKDFIQVRYGSQEAASAAAKEMAKKEPTVPFAVMSVAMIFETTEPKVVEKTFNDAGELVLKEKDQTPAQIVRA